MAITSPKDLLDTILVENSIKRLELEREINAALKSAEMVSSTEITIVLKTRAHILLAKSMLEEAGYKVESHQRMSHPMAPSAMYKLFLIIPPQGK